MRSGPTWRRRHGVAPNSHCSQAEYSSTAAPSSSTATTESRAVPRQKLAAETRHQLTGEELEELIPEADAYPTPYWSFPNKCPICGAPTETRRHGPTEYSGKGVWPVCTSCGWGGG